MTIKHYYRASQYLITALVAAAGSAYAQQPPNIVNSDQNGNTAMGPTRSCPIRQEAVTPQRGMERFWATRLEARTPPPVLAHSIPTRPEAKTPPPVCKLFISTRQETTTLPPDLGTWKQHDRF